MKILRYHYRDVEEPGWEFTEIKFGKINLLVGDTATGKTRLLNTMFNLGRFAAKNEFKNGNWDLSFEHEGSIYNWSIDTKKQDDPEHPGIIDVTRIGNGVLVSDRSVSRTGTVPVGYDRDGSRAEHGDRVCDLVEYSGIKG